MDLHSYAKGAKKWSIEHTRKLVNARINYDNMFANHPVMSLVPWKKFVHLAKLDDYNVLFVRNQWFGLVETYKHHKELRLNNLSAKSSSSSNNPHDILLNPSHMSDDWEFFPPIHRFMTHKTTNLHSYALKEPNNQGDTGGTTSRRAQKSLRQQCNSESSSTAAAAQDKQKEEEEDQQQQQINNILSSITSSSVSTCEHHLNLICSSSDTNDEFAAAKGLLNDHDFYSKKSNVSAAGDQQSQGNNWPKIRCFGDGSDDTEEALLHHHHQLIENNNCSSKLVTFDDDCAVEMQLPGFIREEITETTTTNPMNAVYAVAAAAAVAAGMKHINQNSKTKSNNTTQQQQQRKSRRIQNIKIIGKNQQQKEQSITGSKYHQHHHHHQQQQQATSVIKEPQQATEERLAYYRHKRRYNHRQEKRFDALLSVLGEIVKNQYPNVDMTPLNTVMGTLSNNISSDEELT